MQRLALAAALFGPSICGANHQMVGEYGGIQTPSFQSDDNAWVLVEMHGEFSDPVVFGGVPSATDADEVVVRFRNLRRGQDCSGWCFDMRLQEPSCRDGAHEPEEVGWMAKEVA